MKKVNFAAHSDQRVGVFIDTQNLYHSAKANFQANVSYQELMEQAVNNRMLVRAFAYVIKSEESTEDKFIEAIQGIGIEVRLKDIQVFHTGAKKADWDVGIAVDMIRLSEKVDVIVLASGDGDFLEVVRYCQSRGVRVEVMAFEKTTNAKLKEESDHFIDLGASDGDFLINTKRRVVRSKTSGYSAYSPAIAAVESKDYDVLPTTATASSVGYREVDDRNLYEKKAKAHYAGSNLSAVNRNSTKSRRVSPSIFGGYNSVVRKVKPVVGLPAKPTQNIFQRQIAVNDETKRRRNLGNAFGNPEPKAVRKKQF